MKNKYPLLSQEEPFDKADLDQVLKQLCSALAEASDLTLHLGHEAEERSQTLYDLVLTFCYHYIGRKVPREFLSTTIMENDAEWTY